MEYAKKPYVIVVGVDASEPAEAALERALSLASSHERSEIHAISAAEEFEVGGHGGAGANTTGAVEASRSELAWRLQQKLDDMHRSGRVDCRARPPRIVTHLRRDRPAHEMARLATVVDADLVVVGAYEERAQARSSWGPVAESLAAELPCRVLVVQPPHHRWP